MIFQLFSLGELGMEIREIRPLIARVSFTIKLINWWKISVKYRLGKLRTGTQKKGNLQINFSLPTTQ